ncbi:ribosomal protein L35 isoform X2 [Wolffia australiana]
MLRICGKLRPLSVAAGSASSAQLRPFSSHGGFPFTREVVHSPVGSQAQYEETHVINLRKQWVGNMISRNPSSIASPFQTRCFASKTRSRAPATPVTSKIKKTKIKGYSSFKSRFKTLKDGVIRRWRAGKRHNAHLKSKKAKRRLRRPEVVTLAYAKVMKKLHFSG